MPVSQRHPVRWRSCGSSQAGRANRSYRWRNPAGDWRSALRAATHRKDCFDTKLGTIRFTHTAQIIRTVNSLKFTNRMESSKLPFYTRQYVSFLRTFITSSHSNMTSIPKWCSWIDDLLEPLAPYNVYRSRKFKDFLRIYRFLRLFWSYVSFFSNKICFLGLG